MYSCGIKLCRLKVFNRSNHIRIKKSFFRRVYHIHSIVEWLGVVLRAADYGSHLSLVMSPQ